MVMLGLGSRTTTTTTAATTTAAAAPAAAATTTAPLPLLVPLSPPQQFSDSFRLLFHTLRYIPANLYIRTLYQYTYIHICVYVYTYLYTYVSSTTTATATTACWLLGQAANQAQARAQQRRRGAKVPWIFVQSFRFRGFIGLTGFMGFIGFTGYRVYGVYRI